MARFTYPATNQADFVIKLMASQNGDNGDGAQVVSDNEVEGSDTSGGFCGESNNDGQPQLYPVHFDIVFDHPFTASKVVTNANQTDPPAVELTFDTSKDQVIQAKVGISYVSAANAKLDWQTENPGWNFNSVRRHAQRTWDRLLGRIQVSGGSYAQTQEFYSLLYKDFIQPNVTSDVNGQFMGSDLKVHGVAPGSRTSTACTRAGTSTTRSRTDYYTSGAHNFNTKDALADMLAQATTVNDVRPGEALEQQDGYLPEDGTYGCCNPHGFMSTLLEYDSEDLALAQFAADVGDHYDAAMLTRRANNWEVLFDPDNNLLTSRPANGQFEPGVTPTFMGTFPTDGEPYVEGDPYEYLWDVPNDYSALFSLLGGEAKVWTMLEQYLSKPTASGCTRRSRTSSTRASSSRRTTPGTRRIPRRSSTTSATTRTSPARTAWRTTTTSARRARSSSGKCSACTLRTRAEGRSCSRVRASPGRRSTPVTDMRSTSPRPARRPAPTTSGH
jgi:putative alpha-1,2-mannosidase